MKRILICALLAAALLAAPARAVPEDARLESARAFLQRMDGYGLEYAFAPGSAGGEERVDFSVSGDNIDVGLSIYFAPEGDAADVRCWSIAAFAADRRAEALELCNRLNAGYRWARFWLDDADNTLNAALDAALTPADAGALALRAAVQLANIVDDAWPQIRAATEEGN